MRTDCEASVSIQADGTRLDEYNVSKANNADLSCSIVAQEGKVVRIDYSYTPHCHVWHIDLVVDGVVVNSRLERLRGRTVQHRYFDNCFTREEDETQLYTGVMSFALYHDSKLSPASSTAAC